MRSEQKHVGSQPKQHLSCLALQSSGVTEGPHWSLEWERQGPTGTPDPTETAELGSLPQGGVAWDPQSVGGPNPSSISRAPFSPQPFPESGPPLVATPLMAVTSLLPRTTLETLGHEWPCMNSTSISTNTMTRWAEAGP